MTAKRKDTKRKEIDWDAIEGEYRVGQLSVREIARRFGTHERQIRRKAKQFDWQRNLVEEVRRGIKEAVVRSLSADNPRARVRTDEQVVEHAVNRGSGVVQGHLARAENLKVLADRILLFLTMHMDSQEGAPEVTRMILSKSDGFANLVRAAGELADRIQKLERQALSLDDDAKKDDTPVNVHMNYAGRGA